jgi:hypothetical protein
MANLADAAVRIVLPTCPYPGLRPFLDYEASLLFGRARQVREVIERLRQTQFVAVIGGSGSGKSSLVLAGVVPELRSFGIPDAGDFWIPMVCTPGTNASHAGTTERIHTPISRFAWKFSKLLRSTGSPQADAARVEEIAEVFRQEAGFARVIDAYASELDIAPGLAATDARLLFVVDQFEEVFHPTNKGSDDCRLLVERVIDHFFSPHPRCYVVLTMRSEHLNDCAGYLELPDAINKSSYLVRRLDEEELRDAIVGPAQRYLRLVARQSEQSDSVPEAVQFDERVILRVQRDVKSITHDPDHLPLLQHLLARIWDEACARTGSKTGVPADIAWPDLELAVSAHSGAESPLADKINVLRACLESWPETLYLRHPENERLKLSAVLRQLAFKDPNTGMYTQQRINVDDCARFLGDGATRAGLMTLIKDDFVGSVDYLFWDDENPARVTLKVSHESFIRGWSRFRNLIDAEAERFEEFVSVLRKCALWLAKGKPQDLLLESAELRRLRDVRFEEVLSNSAERANWFRFLLLDRDGTRLAQCERDVDEFLRASTERRNKSLTSQKRNRFALAAVGVLVLTLAPIATFSFLVQEPVTRRAGFFFDASSIADQAKIADNYLHVGGADQALATLLDAGEKIEDGRSGKGGWRARVSEYFLDNVDFLPPIKRQKEFLARVAQQAEPRVNGELRSVLTNALWITADKPAARSADFTPRPREIKDARCTLIDADGSSSKESEAEGRLFVSDSRRGNSALRRGIFVTTNRPPRATEIVLHAAGVERATGRCVSTHIILPVPRYLQPRILFDADMRHLLIATEGPSDPSVTLYEMNWERTEDGKGWGVQPPRQLTVVTDQQAVDLVRGRRDDPDVQSMETWRSAGGRAFAVSEQNWRIVSTSAQRLQAKPGELVPLKSSDKGSACSNLRERKLLTSFQPGFNVSSIEPYEHDERCYLITRGNPSSTATAPNDNVQATGSSATKALTAGTAVPRDEILIAVYQTPGPDAGSGVGQIDPSPVASLQFGRYEKDQNRWHVGVSGAHEGWIALLRPLRTDGEAYFGMPASTNALVRLGQDVLNRQAASRAMQAERR